MTLLLRPNEYLKYEAHFSYKVFVFPTLLMSIGILMFLAVWSGVAGNREINLMGHVISLAAILLFIGGFLFLPYIYRRLDNKLKIYAITNQRVYLRRGIINIKEKDIPLAKINDVQIFRTIAQRLFNAGDVIVQVGNDGSSMQIDDINRPLDFRDMVISAIYEAALEQERNARQQQLERNQQQYYQQQQQSDDNYGYGYGYDHSYGQPVNRYNPQQGRYGQPQGDYRQGDNQEQDDKDYYKNY